MKNYNIQDLMPKFIWGDRNGRAIALAIDAAVKYACRIIERGEAIITDIDAMPGWRLDELAREMGIDWYFPEAGDAQKREIIRSAYYVHARLGTPWAIETVARAYFGDAEVEEWPEYGVDPYHFRVSTGNVKDGSRQAELFNLLVDRLKNVRSVYDGTYYATVVGLVDIAVGVYMQTADFIYMDVEPVEV